MSIGCGVGLDRWFPLGGRRNEIRPSEALKGGYGHELRDAALDINVDGTCGAASVRGGYGGTLVLIRDGHGDWWIDAGFTID